MTPTVAHNAHLPAPCRPPLATGFASGACPNLLKQVWSRKLQPRGGRCACGPAKPVPRPLLGEMCPHGRSLRVTPCPPRGPLRLWPGKAGSTAPACKNTPTLWHRTLPPERAAAPVARQSRFRGPCLDRYAPHFPISCCSLPPAVCHPGLEEPAPGHDPGGSMCDGLGLVVSGEVVGCQVCWQQYVCDAKIHTRQYTH